MNRVTDHTIKTFVLMCFLSCWVVTSISVQDETEKEQHISSLNNSVSYNNEDQNRIKTGIETVEDVFISNENAKSEVVGVLAEITSKNAGALNDITGSEGAVVIPIAETATLELKAEAEKLSVSLNHHEQDVRVNVSETIFEKTLVKDDKRDEMNDTKTSINETSKEVTEEIPSFSEWAQKRLEEAEKKFVNESGSVGNNGKSGSVVKLGWKNYASPDCGAKVVAANPEAVSPSSVISPSREEYKLNVCTNRIWFIVELCEAIQAKKIDIANFELFSSTPKEFTVSIGDRFPSREWTAVGHFTAKDERDVQRFELSPHLFGRYIKVEIKSHHGSQHYCPISLFRVYGVSELEVLQKEELSQNEDDDMDDDDDEMAYQDGLTKNMLNSATNAVYSMIKKAAEVLGTKNNETHKKNKEGSFEYPALINSCSTPSHNVICLNCSDLLFGQVYELMSCKSEQIHNLATLPIIHNSLRNSHFCRRFGLKIAQPSNENRSNFSRAGRYFEYLFSDRILAAICNSLAISENRAVLNDSQQLFPNSTSSGISIENVETVQAAIEGSKLQIDPEESVAVPGHPTDELMLDLTTPQVIETPKVTCSTSIEYASQIKPTKTVPIESVETEQRTPQMEQTETAEGDETAHEMGEGQQLEGNLEEQLEQFMGDENGPSTAPPVSSGNDRQKESVFLRLSNRIKALERNVSLSSQYLEELSRRYKKQVEEMQKLEKIIQSMLEERKKTEDRSKELEERVDRLIVTIEKWPSFIFWSITTVTIICSFCWICGGGIDKEKTGKDLSKAERRKSVDTLTTKHGSKTRRPSDQALKIVRSSLIAEERKLSLDKKRRKRSNKGLKRSSSINEFELNSVKMGDQNSGQDVNNPKVPGDWIEENSRLIEIVSLDESENSSLEQFGTIMEQEVPLYTKTAAERRASRISSQYVKPNINGNFPKETESLGNSPKSESEEKNRRTSVSNKIVESRNKKEKKSFRSVLKNVFT